MGYKAAMVRTPFYYKNLLNRADAQVLYFRSVADQAKIPLMIYNWPQATGIDISPEAVAMLSEHPNIIAIKESSGSLEKVMQMIREVKPGFQVLVGSAPTLAPSFSGGRGRSRTRVRECRAVRLHHDLGSAPQPRTSRRRKIGRDRISKAAQLVTTKYGVPGLKYAMDQMGYYGGPPRLPLVTPSLEAKKEIDAAFAGLRG